MTVEDVYTEERLAEYDRDAIAQDDVLVMGFVTVVRNLRAENKKLNGIIDEANEILMDTRSHDIEHQIECHADTLSLAFRTTAEGADRACDVLQRVIQARFPG